MMGSYNIIVKTEEIRRRVQEGDFDSAQKIMDTMVLKKVKNIADLSLFAEICTNNKRYDEAMDLLNRVYKKSKTRRTIYQMVLASIGKKDILESERFFKEYKDIAPNDFNIYIFRYKIDKLKKEPYIVLIDSLKRLKIYSYVEKWAYELAKLYYKAGMEKECIQECSDLILWFGEGSYVEKAKILKAYYLGEVNKEEIIENLKSRAAKGNMKFDTDEIQSQNLDIVEGAEKDSEELVAEIEDNSINDAQDEYLEDTQNDSIEGAQDDSISIKMYDDPDEIILDELANNISKEIDDLLTKEQKDEDDSQATIKDEIDLSNFIKFEDNNVDLEKLNKLSESLDVDIFQIFGNFLHVKSIQNQLVKSLELIMNKHTKSVQMIITGAPSSGKTTLAKDIAVFLNKTGKLQTSRIAKISAIKLNKIDIISMKEELRNSCLVIENASELKKATIDKILELIKYFHGDIAVIFEENKKNMNRLFRECPKLMELFKNRIHLPGYTYEELMGFAYSYIALREYKLHPSALEAMKTGLDKIIENTEKDKQLDKISKYIQSAMTSADLRTGKQLPKLAAEGRLAEIDDILTLLSEDFTYQITI